MKISLPLVGVTYQGKDGTNRTVDRIYPKGYSHRIVWMRAPGPDIYVEAGVCWYETWQRWVVRDQGERKVKRTGWVNIYPPDADSIRLADISGLFLNRSMADKYMRKDRIACVQIEWEE